LAMWRWHHTWREHHWSSTRRHHLMRVRHEATWWLSSATWYWGSHHVRITHRRRATRTRILSPSSAVCASSWRTPISTSAPGTPASLGSMLTILPITFVEKRRLRFLTKFRAVHSLRRLILCPVLESAFRYLSQASWVSAHVELVFRYVLLRIRSRIRKH
jgi:hypothetical protein